MESVVEIDRQVEEEAMWRVWCSVNRPSGGRGGHVESVV